MATPYDTNTTADVLIHDLQKEIAGKTILVTGASPGGLGAIFAEQIAKANPKLLILAGRTISKLQSTADTIVRANNSIETRTLPLDLESFTQVREAAATVNGWADVPHIDVLVNNAGIMACEYATTENRIERQFAAGHLGPFLFTNFIMRKLLAAPSPRVVMVSSNGHRLSAIRWLDIGFSEGKSYNKWRAYGQAKTANILMGVALAKRLGEKGLTAVSLHPGAIKTNLSAHLDWQVEFGGLQAIDRELGNTEAFAGGFDYKTPERGVATHIFAAFEPSLRAHNGTYLTDSHVADPYTDTVKPYAVDGVEADRLWKLSEELVGEKFTY